MDKSAHRNNPTERGALTNWSADGQTNQDTETIRPSEGHSLPGERRRMDKSGPETIRPSEGHSLPGERRPDGQSSQDTETIQPSEGHSLPGERRRTDKSGHGNNPTEQGALTSWRTQGRTS